MPGGVEMNAYPLIKYYLVDSFALWRAARHVIKDLFFYSILIEPVPDKIILGHCFVQNYERLVVDFINDTDAEASNLLISLQLLTTPSVSSQLVKDYRIHDVVMKTITDLVAAMRSSAPNTVRILGF